MRIWLLRDSEFLPTDGANIRLLRMGLLADELAKRGHNVVWWTSTFDHFKKKFRETCDKDLNVTSNYRIKLLHGTGYKKNISLQRILHNRVIAEKFLKKAQQAQKPDIILASLPTIELALAATQYGKQSQVPVILDLRDMWPDIFLEVIPKVLQPFARVALEWQFRMMKKTCEIAAGLIGITPEFLQWGLSYARRKQNTFDAVYPLSYSDIKPNERDIKEAVLFWEDKGLKANDNHFIISFVGSVNKTFKLDVVIEAVKQLCGSVTLVIAGVGPMLENYQELAKGCNNIIFSGLLDKTKIYQLLQMSSVGIAPYVERKDFLMSIPNKIGEYLSAGLPIVTSISGVVGTLLGKNQCGLIYEVNDVNELVATINKLKDNVILQKAMSKNARDLYKREFVAEKVYASMADRLEQTSKAYKSHVLCNK